MTAPTEAEIREAIETFPDDRLGGDWGSHRDNLRGIAIEAADKLTPQGYVHGDGGLWQDSADLQEAMEAAATMAGFQCETVIVSAMVAAAVRFATDHPDAPRVSN